MKDLKLPGPAARHGRRSLATAALLCPVAATSVGCARSATITMQNGHQVNGPIVGTKSGMLVVEQNGEEKQLPADNVRDIQHPGDAPTIAGGVLLGVGVLGVVPGAILLAANAEDDGPVPLQGAAGVGVLALSGALIATGIPLLVWGLDSQSTSEQNADGIGLRIEPSANVNPATGTWSAGLQGSF